MFTPPTLNAFRLAIDALPDEVSQDDILNEAFLMGREGRLAVYYAPLEGINLGARIILLGLTPGWTQTKLAFEVYRRGLRDGLTEHDALMAAKGQASFAGMRTRLCRWLDELGVAEWLKISGTASLFDARADLLHTASAIRYPVFMGSEGLNYSGHNPAPRNSPLLTSIIESVLLPELALLPTALVVPMGRSVSAALSGNAVDPARCLFGFPHPSGANGHGTRQYAEQREAMRTVVERLAT